MAFFPNIFCNAVWVSPIGSAALADLVDLGFGLDLCATDVGSNAPEGFADLDAAVEFGSRIVMQSLSSPLLSVAAPSLSMPTPAFFGAGCRVLAAPTQPDFLLLPR